jgi:hypothetical protein
LCACAAAANVNVVPRADLPVRTVDAGGADPDTDLGRPRVRLVDVIEGKHVRRAVPLETNRLHDSFSTRWVAGRRWAVTIRRLIRQ